MKFIVDRKTWYRGHGERGSKLLREDGMRCCIGFVGKKCGASDSSLLNKPAVSRADAKIAWPTWFYEHEASLLEAYMINDARDLTNAEREKQLTALFAEFGDEIKFVN